VPDFAWPAIKQARCSKGSLEITVEDYNSCGEIIQRSHSRSDGLGSRRKRDGEEAITPWVFCYPL
jgi:hypothetical protein